MTSLPKRGDRVRVTEFMAKRGVAVVRATPVVLTEDARDHGEGYVSFRYHSPASETYVGPVKVEILERAGGFDYCGGSDESPPEHTQDCSGRPASERVCADCGLPVSHRVHRGFGPCGGQSERASTKALREVKESIERIAPTSVYQAKQDAAAEFARGMRRAVAIASQIYAMRRVVRIDELKEAVEKEIAK